MKKTRALNKSQEVPIPRINNKLTELSGNYTDFSRRYTKTHERSRKETRESALVAPQKVNRYSNRHYAKWLAFSYYFVCSQISPTGLVQGTSYNILFDFEHYSKTRLVRPIWMGKKIKMSAILHRVYTMYDNGSDGHPRYVHTRPKCECIKTQISPH